MASYSSPALTTVKQPKYEMGECSARTIIRRIEDDQPSKNYRPSINILNTGIVERESVSFPGSQLKEHP
jgi:DNA-binding LacI/PurR family transcriptional regulator